MVCLHAPAVGQNFTLRTAPHTGPPVERAIAGDDSGAAPAWLGESNEGVEAPKSKGKAFLYSLLLPGLGHHYVGDERGARTFFAIDMAAWTAVIVFEIQGALREEGYEDYAEVFAGVAGNDHSDDYYAVIAEYDSWEDYELAIKTEGRYALYPGGDAATLEQYFIENRVSDYEAWEWKSSDARVDYRNLRSSSKLSYRRGLYFFAFAMVNRVASGFFAIKAANDANEKLDANRLGYHLEIGPPVVHPSDGPQTGFTFVATF
jgi:hypothetical protein